MRRVVTDERMKSLKLVDMFTNTRSSNSGQCERSEGILSILDEGME